MSSSTSASSKESPHGEKAKATDVRVSNIVAAKAVADAIRTSLGPKGMDKMIQSSTGEVIISNDGATILKKMEVIHPAAQMLVELSKSQDVEAGDGTTSVVVIAGALLNACLGLLEKGMHASVISAGFQLATEKALDVLQDMSVKLDLKDKDSLLKSATTSLNSKIVSQYSKLLAPIAVEAVMRVIDPATDTSVDLRDIKIVKKLGGTIDDSELVKGLVFPQKASHGGGGPTKIDNARIGLIQFCLSPPKTDIENQVVISEYQAMDRVLREEKEYTLKMCKKIKAAGCNVLLIQKSILRDAISDLARHFLAKMNIMVIKDIERDDVEFICKSLKLLPVAHLDNFAAEKLGTAETVAEEPTPDGKIVRITGIPADAKTVTVLIRGTNKLILDEAERSLHDALCVIRCLVKKRFIIPGGGAPEAEMAYKLSEYAKTIKGPHAYAVAAFADALETIPFTLAENAGLNPIAIVTELRNKHAAGEKNFGINVRKGAVTNILEENVVQPLLVSFSALSLASECVRMLMKVDDCIQVR